jgi:MFS transporter, DHA1 family, tetracycline resistance protein
MKKRISSNPLWIMFFVVLLDLLGFGIIIPILPLLFTDPNSTYSILPAGVTEKSGYILFGCLVAIYPIFQFLAAPVLGQLSDKYGRRRILIISLLGTAVSYFVFAIGLITKNIPLLFVARAFDGLTGGNISVAQAVVADTAEEDEKTRHFGLLGAGFGIGLIIGPYIGGKLSDPSIVSWFSPDTPFWFAGILSLLNITAVIWLLPETLKPELRRWHVHWLQSFNNIRYAMSAKRMHILFATGFLFQCGFTFFTTFISVYLYKNFAFNQGTIGEFFAYAGLWIAFTQAVITKYVHKYFEDEDMVKIGLAGCSISIFALFIISHVWMLYVVVAFFAVANGISQTSFLAIISNSVEPSEQGKILGINSSIYALGQAIPPFLSGFIAASLHPNTPIVVAGAFIAASTFLFMMYHRRYKSEIAAS